MGSRVIQTTCPTSGATFRARFTNHAYPGLKPWAVLYSRFRLRPISPFSYIGRVAAKVRRVNYFTVPALTRQQPAFLAAQARFARSGPVIAGPNRFFLNSLARKDAQPI
jgi:hypothetical protein